MKQNSEKRLKTQKIIYEHLFNALDIISKKGNLQEKLMGIAINSIIVSAHKDSEKNNRGVAEILEAILKLSLANGAVKPGYVEPSLLSLENMGVANVLGLIYDFKYKVEEDSVHAYNKINSDIAVDEYKDEDEDKFDYIKKIIYDLNLRFKSGNISPADMEKELHAAIEKANKIHEEEFSLNIINKKISDTPNVRNKIVSDLFSIYTLYKPYVDRQMNEGTPDSEARDNNAILVMIKSLMIAHKINMTKEIYAMFWNNKKEMSRLIDMVNEIMDETNQSSAEFFFLKEPSNKENKALENKILNDPELDANIKQQLKDLFDNNTNLN